MLVKAIAGDAGTPRELRYRFKSACRRRNDRMLTTCFLAALLHGIVILGVTFSSPSGDANGGDGRRVWKWSWSTTKRRASRRTRTRNTSPQRTQLGSGNTLKRERTPDPEILADAGRSSRHSERRGHCGRSRSAREAGDDELVATHSAGARRSCTSPRPSAADEPSAAAAAAGEAAGLGHDAERRRRRAAHARRGEAAAVDCRGHPRIGRCRLPGQLAPQDRAGRHHELSRMSRGARSSPERR